MSRTRVFVGGLAYRCTERDIEKFFRKYGRIKEIALKNGFAFVEFDDYRDAEDAIYELNGKELLGERVSVERARGTPRGSDQYRGSGGAGQRYSSSRRRGSSRERGGGSSSGRYQSSRRDDNGRSYGSSSGGGERYGPPQRTDYRVYVENLSSRVSWQDLKDYMRQEGCEVAYADAHKEHRNEAIVEFVTHQDMKTALQKLDGMELNGRKIRLIEDKRRPSRSSSRSRSRSKRRSRTRSRSPRSSHSKSKSKSRSRSRSRSGSVAAKRSKSRSRSVSKPRNGKSSRSRSDERASKSRSRSVSKPRNGDASRSRSRSRSRSAEKASKSRSRSASQQRNDDDYAD